MSTAPDPTGGLVLSLRDYFAAVALHADLGSDSLGPKSLAENAYAIADAMLRRRADAPTSWPTLHGNNDFSKE